MYVLEITTTVVPGFRFTKVFQPRIGTRRQILLFLGGRRRRIRRIGNRNTKREEEENDEDHVTPIRGKNHPRDRPNKQR